MRALKLLPFPLGALIAVATLGVSAPAAGAHSETGNLQVDVVVRPGLTAEVQVALSYASDGHPAEDATVSASATGPDGRSAGPVALTPIGLGGYRGELPLPGVGAWTVRAEAVEPAASAETTVEVAASPGPDTPDPDDTEPGDTLDDDDDDGGSGGGGEGDGSDPWPWIVGGVVVAVAVGAGGLLLRRLQG
jgi:hypothetical protein